MICGDDDIVIRKKFDFLPVLAMVHIALEQTRLKVPISIRSRMYNEGNYLQFKLLLPSLYN